MKKIYNTTFQRIIDEAKEALEANEDIISTKERLKVKINDFFEEKSVLGFDIYRYSKFPIFEQTLLPFTYKWLYNTTVKNCLLHEPQVFYSFSKFQDFKDSFIDTGDGGFQIFDDPLQCIFFAIYFQANIRRFNSYKINRDLREILDEITLRYAITTDKIFCYDKNYYGPAIINNARILSKDKLNRFLMDEKTHVWLDKNINGIENLQSITFNELKKVVNQIPISKESGSYIIGDETNSNRIINTDILKIGEIEAKKDTYSIYSLHLQVLMHSSFPDNQLGKYTVSLGNLNTTGISEDR